MIKKTTCF